MVVDDWDRWIDGLRRGDREVQAEFVGRFGPQLEKLADRHLTGNVRRRIGPEDAVQSACRTFLRRATLGEFALPDSDSLWRLLCAITVAKVREQARFHHRRKRGVNAERHLDSMIAEGEMSSAAPAPDVALEFADAFEHVVQALDDDERRLIDMKLQEWSSERIAAELRCSERTVRRMLANLQAKIERMFAD